MKPPYPLKKLLITSYLKDHGFSIVLYFIFVIVFMVIFKLYHLSLQIVFYPTMLCAIIWLFVAIFDFAMYCNAHHQRMNLANHIEITLENLPKPSSLLEQEYQQLLTILMEYNNQQRLKNEQNFRDLSEYITLWTHQVKTPITAIQLLLQEAEGEQGELKEQVVEIERYVDMTLQYMRLDTLNSDLLLKKQSLLHIVKQAVKYHAKSFIGKRISLELEEFDTLVVTDEKWLLFVVKQLLSNSLQYTKTGKISIYVVSETVLIIQDTGIGIAKEDIPRIFERGFTGYNGRMEKTSTGIGLFLVKQILNKLVHEIIISSDWGEGTKVELHFPNLTKL